MLPRFAKQTIRIVEPSHITERGQVVEDWTDVSYSDVSGCSVQPGGGGADFEHADSLTADYTVYLPPETVLPESSFRVELPTASGQFIIMGEPEVWVFGMRTDNIRIRLKRRRDGV